MKRLLAVAAAVAIATQIEAGALPACNAGGRHFDPKVQPYAPVGSGTSYYVDALNGSDSNDGKSLTTAFKTINRAVNLTLLPGDTIRIKGGLYRERIIWKSGNSGAPGSPIVIGAYGDAPVILDASAAVTGWALVSGSVYKAHTGFDVNGVVVDTKMLFPEFSQAALAVGQYFYDKPNKDLYVWTPTGDSPAVHDVGVLDTNTYGDGFFFNGAHDVTLFGVTVRFSGGHGVSVLGDNDTVEWSRIIYNGNTGITLWSYQSTLSTGFSAIKNEIAWNVMENWPRGRMKWCCWGMGITSNGVDGFLFQGNVSHNNGGEGMGSYSMTGGAYLDNIVYDNWSVNIYTDHGVTIQNNFVYQHDPNPGDLFNNQDPTPSDGINLKHLRAEGIETADETWPPKNTDPVVITNNVIVNCRHGYLHWAGAGASSMRNVTVAYNTIVVPRHVVPGETIFDGIVTPYNGGNNVNSFVENNVVYASNPTTYVLYSQDQPTSGDGFVGLTIDHNLWFDTGSSLPIHWGPGYQTTYDRSVAQWQALPGSSHGAGDVNADPLLVKAADLRAIKTKVPLPGSPAIGAALDDGIAYDYNFCQRPGADGLFDLGAFEVQ